MTTEVLPCPFCGGTNIHPRLGPFRRLAFAVCCDCEAQGPEVRVIALDDHRLDTSDAMRAWNTRVNPEHLSPSNPWLDIQILMDGFRAALFYVLEDYDPGDDEPDDEGLDDSARMERITQAMAALCTLERLRAEQNGQERLDLEPNA